MVGYDDRLIASVVRPTLTTVSMPTYAMGHVAAEILLEQLKHPEALMKHKLVQGELILRQSCGSKEGQSISVLNLGGIPPVSQHSESILALNPQPKAARLRPVSFTMVKLAGGFWGKRQVVNRIKTLPAISFFLRHSGLLPLLKKEQSVKLLPPSFPAVESPIAQWIEAASYTLASEPDSLLERQVDELIDLLGSLQEPNGYLNTYITLFKSGKRWKNLRDLRELYNAGHLIEAGVTHFQATQRRTLLQIACRLADLLYTDFGPMLKQTPGYDGHPEIELALIRLYRVTGEQCYLDLASFFINERGRKPYYFDLEALERGENPASTPLTAYAVSQAHLPVREQKDARGNALGAVRLYAAMADLALEKSDNSLLQACETLYESVVNRQMYLTGGIGSSTQNAGFTTDFDLPNETAQVETCAAIGLFQWMHRMLHLDCNARYSDIMERSLYNAILSGISLEGDHFFQRNSLAVQRKHEAAFSQPLHRRTWFDNPCSPPDLARFIASLGSYIYSKSNAEVVVHLYLQSKAEVQIKNQKVTLDQETDYPWNGTIHLSIKAEHPEEFTIKLRVPGWCQRYSLEVNGQVFEAQAEKGYLAITRCWKTGDKISLNLEMPAQRVYPHPNVSANQGRVALQKGPLVYCLEEVDHLVSLETIFLPRNAKINEVEENIFGGVVMLQAEAFQIDQQGFSEGGAYQFAPPSLKPITLKAVPYYTWGNRTNGDMCVWIHELP